MRGIERAEHANVADCRDPTAGATPSAAQVAGAPIVSGVPSQIVVFSFATSTADVSLNQGIGARLYRNWSGEDQDASQAQLAQSTAQNICVQVASSLASNGWNAACQPRGTPLTGNNVLIIDGAFTDISEGNRLLFPHPASGGRGERRKAQERLKSAGPAWSTI